MTRTLSLLVVVVTAVAVVGWLSSLFWPAYHWDVNAASPDGRYNLVVLSGHTGDYPDASYRVYVFPAAVVANRAHGERVPLTPTWSSEKYLIYSGYNYPRFRWAGARLIEFDIDDHDLKPFGLYPFKRFSEEKDKLEISVVYGPRDFNYIAP